MSYRAITIFLIITLVTLLGLSDSRADGEKASPALVLPSPRYDAGTCWEGDTVSHTFEAKNGGSAELRILNVKPG
jgi:hypothetical protein